MYPPKVSEAQILEVIADMRSSGTMPSGSALRAELARRFGSRGGVARIYALLRQAVGRYRALPPMDGDAPVDLLRLRQQLQLAHEREESDQRRWAGEIDRLRLRVAELEPLALQAQRLRETAELLRHRLQAADIRVSTLETDLLRLQASMGQSPR